MKSEIDKLLPWTGAGPSRPNHLQDRAHFSHPFVAPRADEVQTLSTAVQANPEQIV
jgi:hypothetical protein